MKLVISLLFISISSHSLACRLTKPIVNLSGPLTMIMKKFGLLDDPNLKAVSSYYLNSKEAKKLDVDLLMGGIFLSPKIIKRYRGSLFLIDESQELKAQFRKLNIKVDSFITRELTPPEVISAAIFKLKSYTVDCRTQILDLNREIEAKIKSINKANWSHIQTLFFLGSIKNNLPKMLMINDGFVKYLKDELGLKSYPSDIAYSGWSQLILKKMFSKKTLIIGLVANDEMPLLPSIKNVNKGYWDVMGRYILIPGIGQVELMYFLSLNIDRLTQY